MMNNPLQTTNSLQTTNALDTTNSSLNTSTDVNDALPIDPILLEEAASWAMVFQYDNPRDNFGDNPDDTQHQAFERWKSQSTEHQVAWSKAQAVFNVFDQVPTGVSKKAINNLQNGYDRRQTLQLLSTLLVAIPISYMAVNQLPWQRWRADVATSTGEPKTISLPDGSQITLNTNSAIDIVFNDNYRRIRLLNGEVLITTHSDPTAISRPFIVDTPCGIVRALGTKFSVRNVSENNCHVAVFEHSVEIRTLSGALSGSLSGMNAHKIVHAGKQTHFTTTNISPPTAVNTSAILWQKGMLLVKDMRLGDVINKLSEYRTGRLRCDADVADLFVSGSLSLTNTNSSLALLQKNLPIKISYLTPYWVTVKNANG